MIDTAARMRREHADVLKQVQDKYGVPPEIPITTRLIPVARRRLTSHWTWIS